MFFFSRHRLQKNSFVAFVRRPTDHLEDDDRPVLREHPPFRRDFWQRIRDVLAFKQFRNDVHDGFFAVAQRLHDIRDGFVSAIFATDSERACLLMRQHVRRRQNRLAGRQAIHRRQFVQTAHHA